MLYSIYGEFKNNDEYKTFLESVKDDVNLLEKYTKQMFIHLIKWRYQPNRQSRSWIDSIRKSHYLIQEVLSGDDNINIINRINLQKIYEDVRKKAITEMNLDNSKNKNLEKIIPIEIPTMSSYVRDMEYLNWDWVFITNKEYIIDYLYVFHDPTGTYAIDLDKELKGFK